VATSKSADSAREIADKAVSLAGNGTAADSRATSGLMLLNAALSQIGKKDDFEWQPRVWRLPR
jgi:hypothetical protein